jgi:hypothetical protein
VTGNIDGRIAEGTARYRVKRGDDVVCDSERITWRARKKR